MKKITEITVEEVIRINAAICSQYREPHLLRDQHTLQSAIEVGAFYRFPDGRYAQGGVASIAGTMCYKIAQAQAFLNGNKRTAYLSAKAFLGLNGFELRYPQGDLESLIYGFAGPPGAPKVSIEDAKEWFQTHTYRIT